METQIRKIGNSSGVILPSILLKKLHLAEGDLIKISDANGRIVIESIKPKYTLSELIDQCDIQASTSEHLNEWDSLEPVGLEVL